jgi:2-polyprenyl-3-methyl-5-hydroxy-6-metoxy-1,4-benzoquinol methylase
MLSVARCRASEERVAVQFLTGDAHQLELPDRAFDVVVSLRVLMHTPDWRRCMSELCRVAGCLVIVDYPSATSFAALQAFGRRAIFALGARTEPYRVLSDRSVARALEASGFRVRSVHRQFVLPIALHKAIGSPRFTTVVERFLSRVGLAHLVGTPVTLAAERCTS